MPKVEVKDFGNPLLEKKFVIESNILRRHLTPLQRIKMAKPLIEIEKELAKRRKEATWPEKGEKGFQPINVLQNFGEHKEDQITFFCYSKELT